MNILRTASLGSNYTGSYKKECTSTGRRKPLQCNQKSTLSFMWSYLFFYFHSESPFVYKVINKTKLSMTNFQKQSPQNIMESLSLNNRICTYNTPYIFFVLFNHLFIHYSFCRVCINNMKVWGTLMQFYHNEWNLKNPQILFQNLLYKSCWWKNTLFLKF